MHNENLVNDRSVSIGEYLIERLFDHGIGHVFGVPGDFILGFYHQLVNSRIKVINMCDEQGAGFAADAYARINGLGVVCITYCVGGLKVINPTAGAFAEKSPLVVISGSPGIKERIKDPLLHHKVRNFETQLKIFDQITVTSTVLDNPLTAAREINRCLNTALRLKRPVYIEIPRDMVSVPILVNKYDENDILYDQEQINVRLMLLKKALQDTVNAINLSNKPVILAGVELHRYGLQKELISIVEKFNIPVVSTLSSKSVISELHPLYLGLYEGAMGHRYVREYVESSDCPILLGSFLTDLDLGGLSSKIDQERTVTITSEKVSIKNLKYQNICFEDLVREISASNTIRRRGDVDGLQNSPKPLHPFSVIKGKKITINRLFQRLNSFLKDDMMVLADVGDALFGSTDLTIHLGTEFLSSAYYASMGFAVPASIGAKFANPKLRPLVLVGDGAFQMTGMEISTAFRFNLNPIVLVLNNRGYGTERFILDGSFNNIPMWKYSIIPQFIGGGKGYFVETEEQFEDALLDAENNTESFCILDICLDPSDRSHALQRLTHNLKIRATTHG